MALQQQDTTSDDIAGQRTLAAPGAPPGSRGGRRRAGPHLSRRGAVAACLLVALALALVLVQRHPSGRLFAGDSVWNATVPADAPTDPRSEQLVRGLVAEVGREIRTGTGPWISTTSYSSPLYVVGKHQRRVRVQLDTGSWGASLRGVLAAGVPIPEDARPAAGTDGHVTIFQPQRDTLWEFWQASKRPDGWHARWGGKMGGVSESPGYYRDRTRHRRPIEQSNWGATATSLPVIAGVPRISELRQGRIRHALAIAIPEPCAGWFAWPAQRTDGGSRDPGCLPEGARLRLDPRLDLNRLRMPPLTRMLAEAAQRYGMIVRDKTGGAIGFYLEAPKPGPNPYRGPGGLFGGLEPSKLVGTQFPWQHLQVLELSPCTRAPCARGS